jgi:DNA-directed RNA polymerase specialized sigma24 family protein
MNENVENLMFEDLKRFQTTLERVDRRLGEFTIRQSETHTAVLGLRRDQLSDAEISAHLQVQLDGVRDRLDRIERRLELGGATPAA